MADKTGIVWTDSTWNPVTGCTRVSPGCTNCYVDWSPPFRIEGRHFTVPCEHCGGTGFEPMTGKFRDSHACSVCKGEGEVRSHAIGSTTGVRLHPERLDQPLRWRRPRKVFVNSLSDLFHDDVPDEYIARVWAVMALSSQHTFQVLTKRHARMRSLLNSATFQRQVGDAIRGFVATGKPDRAWYASWPLPNVWVGVTVEDQERADLRVPALLDTPAAVRFLSCEPLLGHVDLLADEAWLRYKADARCDLCGEVQPYDEGGHETVGADGELVGCPGPMTPLERIDWVIAGGESGPDARPMHPNWARSLRDQCQAVGVPFLFKQWGEHAPQGWAVGSEGPMVRMGKKAAGRELDGRTWDEYPKEAL